MIKRLIATVKVATSTAAATHDPVIVMAGEVPPAEDPLNDATNGIVIVDPPVNAAAALSIPAMRSNPVEIMNA
ncbi:MAG: hypothetical protein ACOH1M_05095 [Rhodoglobus sp.]